jgi:putative two-component system response regulator
VTAGPQVLIVDDDTLTLSLFAQVLGREGYTVRVASSALVGLREAETARPDAILLDFRMPFINGAGFLYRLRSNPLTQGTPVAVITGDVTLDDEACRELYNLGAEVWFKPLDGHELVNGTRLLLAKSSTPGAAAGP